MKRLILTGAIFAVILAVCLIGVNMVDHYTEEMSGLLQKAVTLCEADDYDNAAQAAAELEERWVQIEPKISFFISHSTVDRVGEAISRLYPLAEQKDGAQFLAECRAAQIALLHITEDEKISFWAVF